MDYLIFFLVTIFVATYLFVQYFSICKLFVLNDSKNILRVDKNYKANETFKVLILSMVMFFLALMLFVPKSFSLYEHIFIGILIYLFGIVMLYESSTKNIYDIFVLSIFITINNIVIFMFPSLFLILINIAYF